MRYIVRISSLQKDNETFQGINTKPQSNLVRFSANAWLDAKRKFKGNSLCIHLICFIYWHRIDEIDVLKRDILKVEELYTSTKAQKDSLEEQLNENKPRAASDRGTEGSGNKRRREEWSSSNGSYW